MTVFFKFLLLCDLLSDALLAKKAFLSASSKSFFLSPIDGNIIFASRFLIEIAKLVIISFAVLLCVFMLFTIN